MAEAQEQNEDYLNVVWHGTVVSIQEDLHVHDVEFEAAAKGFVPAVY